MHGKCKGVWKWGKFLLVGPTHPRSTLVHTPFLCQLLLSSSFLATPQASHRQTPEHSLCLNPTNVSSPVSHVFIDHFSATLGKAWATFATASRTSQSTGQ